jgi:hypothetical protein
MSAAIFSGDSIRILKRKLKLNDQAAIGSGPFDPRVTATLGSIGDIFISTSLSQVFQKITTNSLDTNWQLISTLGTLTGLTGDVTASGSGSVAATVLSVGGSSASSISNTVNEVAQATDQNTASTLVRRDATGSIAASLRSSSIESGVSSTIAIGTGTATSINIGNPSCTVNIVGNVISESTSVLQVSDPLITINKGGASGSASSSGIEIEENSVITGYLTTSADRTSFTLKAPASSGIATVVPGSGIVLNQSSHNPVTIATTVGSTPNASAASLNGQEITLQPASSTQPGVVTSLPQSFGGNKTFTGIISASNLSGTNTGDQTITLSGDVSGTGSGAITSVVNSVGGSSASSINNATIVANTATPANSANAVVRRDGSGNFSANIVTASLTGNATNVTGIVGLSNGGTGRDLSSQNGTLSVSGGTLTVGPVNLSGSLQGNLSTIHLNSGTNANSSTYWRGDGVWASPVEPFDTLRIPNLSIANNQSTPQLLGSIALDASITSLKMTIDLVLSATVPRRQAATLYILNRTGSYEISYMYVGDSIPVDFTIDASRRLVYTSGNISGFVFCAATVRIYRIG